MVRNALIADDDALIRLVLRSALEGRGFSVQEAHDGDELLAVLGPNLDLVLMDAGMPGPSLSSRLTAAQAVAPQGRIVVMSGSLTAPRETAAAGVAFLAKPVALAALASELDSVGSASVGAA